MSKPNPNSTQLNSKQLNATRVGDRHKNPLTHPTTSPPKKYSDTFRQARFDRFDIETQFSLHSSLLLSIVKNCPSTCKGLQVEKNSKNLKPTVRQPVTVSTVFDTFYYIRILWSNCKGLQVEIYWVKISPLVRKLRSTCKGPQVYGSHIRNVRQPVKVHRLRGTHFPAGPKSAVNL